MNINRGKTIVGLEEVKIDLHFEGIAHGKVVDVIEGQITDKLLLQ